MAAANLIFVGIKGSVVAIDRATGTEVWSTQLKGTDFVNVVICNDDLYAATRGEIFCLDQGTGSIRWRNALKGYGLGLMTIAAPGAQDNQTTIIQKRRREQEEAAAAAGAGA
jgi:outer membrane protein assembly factor BamB